MYCKANIMHSNVCKKVNGPIIINHYLMELSDCSWSVNIAEVTIHAQ